MCSLDHELDSHEADKRMCIHTNNFIQAYVYSY